MGNKYTIKKALGEGGFGIVYLVEKDKKQYALKQSKIKLTAKEIEQYKNMINILTKINNEYLIKYYETFIKNDTFNILMEYAGDKNLKQFIQDYRNKDELIDEKIIIDIISQICKGLKEIHDNKIIHRDLTPDNIFIDENNKIKIGDFGVSKTITTYNKYAKSLIGKSHYLAPEIEKGIEYNNKVDIYSLGCIIYELFTTNEYYIDKVIDEKDCKINIDIYNSEYQKLIDLLIQKDYHQRPNIDEVINFIGLNYITAEINIEEEDINKDIRIINSYEEYIRNNNLKMETENFNKYNNEKEIKDNFKIEINNKSIDLNYFYKFQEKGKYNIKYIYKNNITKTDFMLYGCELITYIDLSNFNAKNINYMNGMFGECISLAKINLSNSNTHNVTDMSNMFYNCESLTEVDLSGFNTKNVINMSNMFYNCESLTEIDLSGFNTKNVINMSNMFYNCESLTHINLSNFNTQNVKNMNGKFYKCKSLKSINLSNFNTQNVIDMSYMFSWCESLKKIYLSNFNTHNVTNMKGMFYECKSLKNLNLSDFDTQNVIDMDYIFSGCKSLMNINLTNFNTQNVKNMSGIFDGCNSLKKQFVITNDKNILKKFN